MDGYVDREIGRWMDRQMDRYVDGCTDIDR
jgi:hypothetical protein